MLKRRIEQVGKSHEDNGIMLPSSDEEEEEEEEASSSSEEDEDMSLSSDSESQEEEDDEEETATASVRPVVDEYEVDSSDEEDLRNTVGNIPMEWYKEYEHVGYDLLGKKIMKPEGSSDEIDEFLRRMDDPNFWRTVNDHQTGKKVVLSDEDVDLIERYRSGNFVNPDYDPYEPWVEWFSSEVMQHPLRNLPDHKKSFIPSLTEKAKVNRLVLAIKRGWIKPKPAKEEDESQSFYALWSNEEEGESSRPRDRMPAPKEPLPSHRESYNPPPEYLFNKEEEEAWNAKELDERSRRYKPQKYDSLRKVPGYSRFIKERFERCLDLYLCPRKQKVKTLINPEDLLPKLPKPQDLQPFPTTLSLIYKGHSSLIRCISVSPCGQWLASGSDDGTVKLWEVHTARCLRTIAVGKNGEIVRSLAWNPNTNLSLLAAGVDNSVYVIVPPLGDKLVVSNTENMIESYVPEKRIEDLEEEEDEDDEEAGERKKKRRNYWESAGGEAWEEGIRLRISHGHKVMQLCWHGRGDYLAAVMPEGKNKAIIVHQISKRKSQAPFKKLKGAVQKVAFHPVRPFLFVATQQFVRVYNLAKQEQHKKLKTSLRWISSISVHPGGDNVIVGSYDCKLAWFDMDLSTKPYKTIKLHNQAIRQVAFHKKYPLFASASDDGSIIISHGMVYNDLLQNPLIVPVKILKGHTITNHLGVLDCEFHPSQPWIFTSGADHTIRLFT